MKKTLGMLLAEAERTAGSGCAVGDGSCTTTGLKLAAKVAALGKGTR